jgi:hypothetical protein
VFVSLYRLAGADPLRVNLTTIFGEGGALMTTSPGVGQSILSSNDRLIEEKATDLATLVERHRQHVQDFTGPRALTVRPTTIRGFVGETLAFAKRNVPKSKAGGLYGTHFMFVMPLYAVFQGGTTFPTGVRPLLICVCAVLFAAMRWAVLPGRVPRVIRFAVMIALMMAPMLLAFRVPGMRVENAKEIAAILDRVEADAEAGRPIQGVDRLVAHGARPCRALVFRLESDATTPKARRALRDILVQIKGSDLGETPAPWRAWCESTGQRMSSGRR